VSQAGFFSQLRNVASPAPTAGAPVMALSVGAPGWAAAVSAGDTLQLLNSSGAVVASLMLSDAVNQSWAWAPPPYPASPLGPLAVDGATGAVILAACCPPPGAVYVVNVTAKTTGAMPASAVVAITVAASGTAALPKPPTVSFLNFAAGSSNSSSSNSSAGNVANPPGLSVAWGNASTPRALYASGDAYIFYEEFSGALYPAGEKWGLSNFLARQNGWVLEEGSAVDGVTNTIRFEGGAFATFYLQSYGATCTDWYNPGGLRLPIGSCVGAPMIFQHAPLVGSWSAQLLLRAPTMQPGITPQGNSIQCGFGLFRAYNVNGPYFQGPFSGANPNANSM
jgi:hypothetical protein